MNYTHEVEKMECVCKGPKNGPAPIPQEGAWTQAKEIKDIVLYLTKLIKSAKMTTY